MSRAVVAGAERLVVKVGSSSLTTTTGGLDGRRLDILVEALATRCRTGTELVLVSSGAIAAGLAPLGLTRRPRDVATQQAAASVGQMLLVERYAASFARYGLTVGQVLLTSADVVSRTHYRNARRAFDRLLRFGAVPVVNENDAVATEEIRFGDNDRLAALVAHLVGADALVLLSDVDGLYESDPASPDARRLTRVLSDADLTAVDTSHVGGGLGTGGMASKVDAARVASQAGIPVVLAHAEAVVDALAGHDVGTWFAATGRRSASRLLWLRHASAPAGRVLLDEGAVRAVVQRRASLLAAGITGVEGDFSAGDPVELAGADGVAVARGLAGYDADELGAMLGRRTDQLEPNQRRAVVHRDALVLL